MRPYLQDRNISVPDTGKSVGLALGYFIAPMAPRSSVSTQDLYQEHTLREFRMCILELKTL